MKMALMNRSISILSLLLLPLLRVAASASLPSLSLPPLVPAFAWSNHRQLGSRLSSFSAEAVSSEDLVEKLKNEFVWPTIESGQQQQQEDAKQDVDLDVVLVFVGTKLRSGDVSRAEGKSASNLLQVLSRVVSSSNSSMSLPFVTPPKEGASVTDVVVKEIAGAAEDSEERLGEVITSSACVSKNAARTKRLSLNLLREYLSVRMSTRLVGKTDLVVVCSSSEVETVGSKSLSEGEILDELLWGLDEMSARYVALYTTDLSREKTFPVRPRGRQLGSVVHEGEEFCDEVCKGKAFLLEVLLVGLTLLIILISGLCCMSGIASPSRFEQNKDGQ